MVDDGARRISAVRVVGVVEKTSAGRADTVSGSGFLKPTLQKLKILVPLSFGVKAFQI